MYKSRPNKWTGVPINWIKTGEDNCANFNAKLSWILNCFYKNFPKIGGIVNADAIAMISLKKKSVRAEAGNFLSSPWPNLWANALSLISERVVLTKNVDNSFTKTGSIQFTWIWSARFEVV